MMMMAKKKQTGFDDSLVVIKIDTCHVKLNIRLFSLFFLVKALVV